MTENEMLMLYTYKDYISFDKRTKTLNLNKSIKLYGIYCLKSVNSFIIQTQT